MVRLLMAVKGVAFSIHVDVQVHGEHLPPRYAPVHCWLLASRQEAELSVPTGRAHTRVMVGFVLLVVMMRLGWMDVRRRRGGTR